MIPVAPLRVFLKICENILSSWGTVINDTGDKLITSVVTTGGKSTAGINDTGVHIFPEICIDSGDTDTDAGGKLQQVSTTPLSQHRQHKQIVSALSCKLY
jgi:hypothetical protein